jgi:hypothetical protein
MNKNTKPDPNLKLISEDVKNQIETREKPRNLIDTIDTKKSPVTKLRIYGNIFYTPI